MERWMVLGLTVVIFLYPLIELILVWPLQNTIMRLANGPVAVGHVRDLRRAKDTAFWIAVLGGIVTGLSLWAEILHWHVPVLTLEAVGILFLIRNAHNRFYRHLVRRYYQPNLLKPPS